jgi:hypothetical protein
MQYHGNAVLVHHSAIYGRSEQEITWFQTGDPRPQAQFDRVVDLRFIQKGERRRAVTTMQPTHYRYIEILVGGRVVWDSRTEVRCDMNRFEEIRTRRERADAEVAERRRSAARSGGRPRTAHDLSADEIRSVLLGEKTLAEVLGAKGEPGATEPGESMGDQSPKEKPMGKTVQLGERTFRLLFADLLRPLTAEERAGLKEDTGARGILTAILVDEDDGVIDGGHRLAIAAELGLPLADVPLRVLGSKTTAEKPEAALAANLHRRHLSPEDQQRLRQERIARVVAARQDGKSYRAIAAEEGKSVAQVQRDYADAGVPGGTPEPGAAEPDSPGRAPEPTLFDAVAPPPQASDIDPNNGKTVVNQSKSSGGKVKGRDGKTYPASRKKAPAQPAAPKFRWSDLRLKVHLAGRGGSDLMRLSRARVADRDPEKVREVAVRLRRLADELDSLANDAAEPWGTQGAEAPAEERGEQR